MTPQLLIAGHIVKDRTPGGWTPGGGALYAAAQAARLGIDTVVVTACEEGIEPADLVPGVSWYVERVPTGITFENIYSSGGRTQRLLSTSTPICLSDIPEVWRGVPQALLTPVFHDLEPEAPAQLVSAGLSVAVASQGWLRVLDGDRVRPGKVERAPRWLHGDVVFVSEEDVEDPGTVSDWLERLPVVVLTRGRSGYTVWHAGGRHDEAPVSGCERDPTGAGDVFATAYVVRYAETGDVLLSARFAAAAAAISVEGAGIEAVAGREEIEARLRAYEASPDA